MRETRWEGGGEAYGRSVGVGRRWGIELEIGGDILSRFHAVIEREEEAELEDAEPHGEAKVEDGREGSGWGLRRERWTTGWARREACDGGMGAEAAGGAVRTMCGSRTGGWSLPCVMSD
jgi:hypothetical protein